MRKKLGMLLKKLLETKEPSVPLCFYHGEKQKKQKFDKKEIAETLNNYFVDIGPNLAVSFVKAKLYPKTIFAMTVLVSVPTI